MAIAEEQQTAYWQHWGLSQNPFDHLSAKDLFVSAQWKQHLDLLQHLALYSHVLLTVIGSSGVGKTSLAALFLQQIATTIPTLAIQAQAETSTEDFFKQLSTTFLEQEFTSNDSVAFNQALQAKETDCLLVIDNAHLLPTSTVDLIATMLAAQAGEKHSLHALLFGEPALESLVTTASNKITPAIETHSIELEPLTTEEATHYLQHRWIFAGGTGPFPIEATQLADVFETSNGIPAKINELAGTLLAELAKNAAPPTPKDTTIMAEESNNTAENSAAPSDENTPATEQSNPPPVEVAKAEPAKEEPVMIVTPETETITTTEVVATTDSLDPDLDLDLGDDINIEESSTPTATVVTTDKKSFKMIIEKYRRSFIIVIIVLLLIMIAGLAFSLWPTSKPHAMSTKATAAAVHQTAPANTAEKNHESAQRDSGHKPLYDKSTPLPPPPEDLNKVTPIDTEITPNKTVESWSVDVEKEQNAVLPRTPNVTSEAIELAANTTTSATTPPTHSTVSTTPQPTPVTAPTPAPVAPTTAPVPSITLSQNSVPSSLPAMTAQETTPPPAIIEKPATVVAAAPAAKIVLPAKTIPAPQPIATAPTVTKPTINASKPTSAPVNTQPSFELSSRNPNHYTLQIIGVRNPQGLTQFIRAHQLTHVNSYKTTLSGKPWYVLIYGDFASRAAALAGVHQLPANIQSMRPWPRQFRQIQKEIRR